MASKLCYRRLFESAKDGILILDAGTGMIVDVNPFLMDLLGYSRDAFLGKQVWELGFIKDIVAKQDAFRELQQKEYVHYEDRPLQTADGRRIDAEFVSNVYHSAKACSTSPRALAEIYHAKDMELFRAPGVQVYDAQVKDARGLIHNVVYHKATFRNSGGKVIRQTIAPGSWGPERRRVRHAQTVTAADRRRHPSGLRWMDENWRNVSVRSRQASRSCSCPAIRLM